MSSSRRRTLTRLYAERPGRIVEVLTHVGHQVKTGELFIKMKNE